MEVFLIINLSFVMLNNTHSEAQLWDQFRSGEPNAFNVMYNQFAKTIFNYGFHLCSNIQLVEDCVHDMFVKLHQKKENLGPTTSIKYYLMKCLRRQILDALEKAKKINSDDITEGNKYDFLFETKDKIGIEQSQNNQLLSSTMLKEVNNLPKKQREIIYLIFYKNLSYEEVANILSLTVRTVYNQVYNALQRLREVNKTFEKFLAA
jgi:RNA polymerase sigma factor (sigma-70 family)